MDMIGGIFCAVFLGAAGIAGENIQQSDEPMAEEMMRRIVERRSNEYLQELRSNAHLRELLIYLEQELRVLEQKLVRGMKK